MKLLSLLIVVAVFISLDHQVFALNCYQGQQNSSIAVSGSAMACPAGALTCVKSVDPSMQVAMRGCQTTNCTLNNMMSATAVCQNSTSYPYQTYCCCYGDGCNSAPGLSIRSFLLLAFSTIAPVTLARYLMN